MIDVLNKVVESRPQEKQEPKQKGFDILPEGTYNTRVVEMKEWKPMTKDIYVNKKDATGRILRDESGNIIKELHKNMTFYNLDITLEITDGDNKGRKIWTSLTTHPNAEFITQGFLFAIGATKMTYGDIPNQTIDKLLAVETFNEAYTKKVIDPDTGLEEEITKYSTRVRKFLRPSQTNTTVGEVEV